MVEGKTGLGIATGSARLFGFYFFQSAPVEQMAAAAQYSGPSSFCAHAVLIEVFFGPRMDFEAYRRREYPRIHEGAIYRR
jgi:hypothetical protein